MPVDAAASDTPVIIFERKRAEWHEWYKDERHGIWRQFSGMFWNDTVFRTLNEARKLASGQSRSSVNPIIAQFLDDGYVANQTAAAKKLIEPANTNASRQILSLRRLLDDARNNRGLVTREAYVCQDGVPYDDQQAYTAYLENVEPSSSFAGIPMSGPFAFGQSRRSHARFDRLSGKGASERRPDDTLSEAYLDRMDRIVEESGAKAVADYGNKFIAHAADAYSRSQVAINGLNFHVIENMHRGLFRVAFHFYLDLLEDSEYSPMAQPMYDQFEHMTAPWVDEDGAETLRQFWQEREEVMDSWRFDPR